MQQIIYYVAASLDGYIAGPNQDVSLFTSSGDGVDYYLEDLKNFETVIMGRNTYEFGYQFGLKPGDKAYPHMEHYIFSESLSFGESEEGVNICKPQINVIVNIKKKSDTDIYLCGGGVFAGWLLKHRLIDKIKLKLNPIILGAGTPLFSGIQSSYTTRLTDKLSFEGDLQVLTYEINY